MNSILRWYAVVMLAGVAACGSDAGILPDGGSGADARGPADVALAGDSSRSPGEATVTTCQDYGSVTVGSYIVQTDYWQKSACPGTQCLDIDKTTGAFTVTQGPDPCGQTVASYPNVLYGCSFGSCSPGSVLPMQVSSLSTVTSSWDFSVGGTTSDKYNVSYDIWFCPDQDCGASGFPGGTELMIWLDHENVSGWKTDLGAVTLAGHTFEVWQATTGSGNNTWTYLAYMIHAPTVTSVKDLDLGAFFQDATTRGFIQPSWYLYAIQAGNELRTGGIPYHSGDFSVSINGITPGKSPVALPGPSCDGGAPTAQGTLKVSDNYVTAGPLHGYAAAWAWVGGGSKALACATPTCNAPGSLQVIPTMNNGVAALTAEPVSCSPAFPPSALCTAGTVTGDPTYNQVAGVGFNLNQRAAADNAGADVDGGVDGDGGADVDLDGGATIDAGPAASLGFITIANSITVSVTKSGNPLGNTALRLQLADVDNNFYCFAGTLKSDVPIPVAQLNTKCWDNSGTFATPSTRFKRVDVIVPGNASADEPFSYCLTGVAVQ
jgi:cellulose 1,4-beta-cellobiosidase